MVIEEDPREQQKEEQAGGRGRGKRGRSSEGRGRLESEHRTRLVTYKRQIEQQEQEQIGVEKETCIRRIGLLNGERLLEPLLPLPSVKSFESKRCPSCKRASKTILLKAIHSPAASSLPINDAGETRSPPCRDVCRKRCCCCWQTSAVTAGAAKLNNDKPIDCATAGQERISFGRQLVIKEADDGLHSSFASAINAQRQSTPHQTPTLPVAERKLGRKRRRDLIKTQSVAAPTAAPQAINTALKLVPLLLNLFLLTLLASGQQVARVVRQSDEQQQRLPSVPTHNVPYKKFYVTRACEWKSNLFVPKSNDIHFAQQAPPSATANGQSFQSQASTTATAGDQQQSLDLLRTLNNNNNSQNWQQQQDGSSRTLLSTESKALILALPIKMSQSFAGYEPACSIRLIVPRNMRILAQLTSRKLTFAQQHLPEYNGNNYPAPELFASDGAPNFVSAVINEEALLHSQGQQQQQQPQSLWLNVSHNPFIETEQRTIETEGNVLAFRFLLERFAARQYPDTRFQVVLTAFQTLSENSDLNGGTQVAPGFQQNFGSGSGSGSSSSQLPAMDANAQFICDQQRLISTNLVCDGFKNCQDGHDEDTSICAALRAAAEHVPPTDNLAGSPHVTYDSVGPSPSIPTLHHQQMDSTADQSAWAKVWHFVRDTHSLAGFFLGFLLVLVLLTCCSCCAYLTYIVVWRRRCEDFLVYWSRARGAVETRRGARVSRGDEQQQEASHLAAAQNMENLLRSKGREAGASQPHPPPRLQSILKKPSQFDRPMEPPPARPSRQAPSSDTLRRGALSSSLIRSQHQQTERHVPVEIFKPTPAKRISRPPSRPVPVSIPARDPSPSATTVPLSSSSETVLPLNSATTTKTTITRSTGTQRITTYHYSSGMTRYSEAYLNRLAEQQQQQQQQQRPNVGSVAPSSGPNVNYRLRDDGSPRTSLI